MGKRRRAACCDEPDCCEDDENSSKPADCCDDGDCAGEQGIRFDFPRLYCFLFYGFAGCPEEPRRAVVIASFHIAARHQRPAALAKLKLDLGGTVVLFLAINSVSLQ